MANDWRETVEEVLALQDDPDMKTNPGPALQWYPAQWLGDAAVQLMSMEARGVHHHLLMTAWKGFAVDGDAVPCSLPEDAEVLKAICHHPTRWAEVWPQVARAWKALGGRLWNLGLCREYLRQMAKRRSSKGSADARWNRSESEKDANASRGHANASHPDATVPNLECSSGFRLQASATPAKKDTCAEPLEAERSTPPAVGWIPYTGQDPTRRQSRAVPEQVESGEPEPWSEMAILETDLGPLRKAYPGVNVDTELAKARSWCLANGTKRKTVRGIPKFLNAWMERAQNGHGIKPVHRNRPRVMADDVTRARRDAEDAAARKEWGLEP